MSLAMAFRSIRGEPSLIPGPPLLQTKVIVAGDRSARDYPSM